jgi:hypothetical protein
MLFAMISSALRRHYAIAATLPPRRRFSMAITLFAAAADADISPPPDIFAIDADEFSPPAIAAIDADAFHAPPYFRRFRAPRAAAALRRGGGV